MLNKNNIRVFNRAFLEGLNQLLTIWLIENYSEKYQKIILQELGF